MNTLRADELYLNHYQLDHDPFAARVPNFKFFPAQRKTILGQLHHLARHSQLMLLVTGPKGSGKTLLRQALIASVSKDTVKIINVAAADCGKVSDVLALLAEELQATDNTVTVIIEKINTLAEQNISLYFMVDDAEQLSEDVIQLLLNLASEQLTGLHLFLFARPNLLEQLENSTLGKEVTFNLPLTPYTLEETKEYLTLRLEGAGQDLNLFTNEQQLDIYTKSGGWPGIINQVARDILIDNMDEQPTAFAADFDENETDNNQLFAADDDTDYTPRATKPKLVLPKKHLMIAGVVAAVLVAILLFSKSPTTEQQPTIVADHYASLTDTANQTTQNIPLTTADTTTNNLPANTDNSMASNTPQPDQAPVQPQITQPAATNTNPNTATPPPVTTTEPKVEPKPVVANSKPKESPANNTSTAQGNAWYRNQAGTQFTIQVSVASTEKAAQDFLKKQSGDFYYFKRLRAGKTDYVITYGKYASRTAAQDAIKTLAAAIQESKPWVRTFASIKQELAN